jgi:prepilin-type N-terminal cleavage/methylation domain-containing protein
MKKNTNNQGFTLIEMMVTVAVFSILMTIVGAIFAQTLDLQRAAFNLQNIEENSRFSLETMAREIRFAEIQSSSAACPGSPTNSLRMTHPVNGVIEYYLSAADNRIYRSVNGIDTILTSEDVNVIRLGFCISGVTEGDDEQPRITILMSMEAGVKNPQRVDLQTTITTRLLNTL